MPKKEKIPPIFTTSKDLAILRSEIILSGSKAEFKLCSQGTKIICPTVEDYNRVGNHLQKKSYEFHTHDLPGSRPFKVVIRGLPDFAVEDVQSELENLQLRPLKVFKMTRKDQEQKNYRDFLFLVHFAKGTTTLKQLQEIRAIHHIIVRWEAYRGTTRSVTQCQRCLRFGHGTRNCYMKPRCSKCGGGHVNNDCEAETRCGNCGNNHPGTDGKCPAREEFIQIRKKASGPKKTRRSTNPVFNPADFPPLPASEVTPTPGFPQVSSIPSPHQREQNQPGLGPSTSTGLYSPEELVRIFIEMSRTLNSCTTTAQQIETLGVFIIKYGRR